MIRKSASYLWSLRREFTKYFIVGVSGLFLDMGTLILFKELIGLLPVAAVILNQPIVLAYNFSLNKYWSFRSQTLPQKQLVRYVLLAAWNYLFSSGSMYIFNQLFGWEYRLVRIGSIIVMVSWNFFLYKYWVYKEKKEPMMNPISEY